MGDLERVGVLAQILATLFVALAIEERVAGYLRTWRRLTAALVAFVPYLALLADIAALTGGKAEVFGLPSRVLFICNLIAATLMVAVLFGAMVVGRRRDVQKT